MPTSSLIASFKTTIMQGLLGKFCDYLESWDPVKATKVDVQTSGTEWLKNTADRNFTTNGIAATFGLEQAFYAFFSATFYQPLQDLKDGGSDLRPMQSVMSWNWQFCSEFGFFQDDNPSDPTSLVSSFVNVSSFARHECKDVFEFAPNLPNVGAILQDGGYKMNPSNTMFTKGENDPWRTLGVQAATQLKPLAIIRESTTDIPTCNAPPEGNRVFGKVYYGEIHGSDFARTSAGAGNIVSSADMEFDLFSKVLGQWLRCLGLTGWLMSCSFL